MNRALKPDVTVELAAGRTERYADAVARALADVKKRAAVRIVDPDAWCQEIELPQSQTQGAAAETVTRLLAREAEMFSGLVPAKTAVVWRRTAVKAGSAVYRVLEIPLSELSAAAAAARAAGVRLAGVTHPDFAESGEMAVPPPAPVTAVTCLRHGLLLACIAGLVCALAEGYLATRRTQLAARAGELEALQRDVRRLEGKARSDRAAAADLEKRIETNVTAPLRRLRARRSYGRILEALAATCPAGGMIRSIRSEGDYTLAIEGVTATSADAESFLGKLGETLSPVGFAVATLSIASLNQLPGGGPWSFRSRIQPVPGEVRP